MISVACIMAGMTGVTCIMAGMISLKYMMVGMIGVTDEIDWCDSQVRSALHLSGTVNPIPRK